MSFLFLGSCAFLRKYSFSPTWIPSNAPIEYQAMMVKAPTPNLAAASFSSIKPAKNPFLSYEQAGKTEQTTGFDSLLNTAIENINTTNAYLSDAENEEIKWAMGETENTHDLTIALQKASVSLQYTVAIRDRLLDAYKEIMQMQI